MSTSKPSQLTPRRAAFIARRALAACLPALALTGAPAHALTTTCVATSQELHDATLAAPGINDNVLIKVLTGTYSAATGGAFSINQTLSQSAQIITISGGWIDCSTKSNGSQGTELVGTATTPALYVSTGVSKTGNEIDVQDLTLHNPTYAGIGIGACLRAYTATNNQIAIERMRLEQCNSANTGAAAGIVGNDGGDLLMRDIVAVNNAGNSSGGLDVETSQNGITRLSHLSITTSSANNAGAVFGGLYVANFNSATTYLSNSVSWGNDSDPATKDLYLGGAQIYLTRVHYGSKGGSVPAGDIMPGTGDPGFVAIGDPHLRSDSILIDSGVANPEGGSGSYDADGAVRVQGPAVDVGAFESDVIFEDGFE